jgi:hypothetical protein
MMKNLNLYLCIAWLLCFSQNIFSQIVLNEIMFNPSGDERTDEFIEIFNCSYSDPIDLNGWLLSDGSDYCTIQSWQQGCVLLPRAYAIILVPKYFTQSNTYNSLIPAEALTLTIDHSSFGSYGLSNSSGELITLCNTDSVIMSQWRYTTPNPDGVSEEKKVPERGDFSFNWGNSFITGGTPGFQNSNRPLSIDLALGKKTCTVLPLSPTRRDSLFFTLWIHNNGEQAAPNAVIKVSDDLNSNGIADVEEIMMEFPVDLTGLVWPDSMLVEFQSPPLTVGQHCLLVELRNDRDRNLTDNRLELPLRVSHIAREIWFNEILMRPLVYECGWIEMQSSAPDTISMNDWSIELPFRNIKISLAHSNILIPPNGMVIISQNQMTLPENWFTNTAVYNIGKYWRELDKNHDRLILQDPSGAIIDSVTYHVKENTGVSTSLERSTINLFEWGFCTHPQGKTPGEPNAFGVQFADIAFKSGSVFLQPFITGNTDSLLVNALIYNLGNQPTQSFHLIIYDQSGVQNSVQIGQFVSQKGLASMDSLSVTVACNPLQSGSHHIHCVLSCPNDRYSVNNKNIVEFQVGYPAHCLIINEILYDTDTRDQEWIELYNPRSTPVDLSQWKIRDNRQKIELSAGSFLIEPCSFVVLSHVPLAAGCGFANLVQANLPELNNSGDVIALYDNTGHLIDSTCYEASSQSERFISLERVRYADSSLDANNWRFCVDSTGSTPGRLNSVSPHDYDLAFSQDAFQIYPKHPKAGDKVNVSIRVKNTGRLTAVGAGLALFYQTPGSGRKILLQEKVLQPDLNPDQQAEILFEWNNPPAGYYEIIAEIDYPSDTVMSNNRFQQQIFFSYSSRIVINEIMYDPLTSGKDWLEIFNAGADTINMKSWSLCAGDTIKKYCITNIPLMLKPGQFLVITADSAFSRLTISQELLSVLAKVPPLNNTFSHIFLLDTNLYIIDDVCYYGEWGGGNGVSLERIQPFLDSDEKNNWSSCVDQTGHTAGRVNSIYTSLPLPAATLTVCPDPFSPDQDGFQDLAVISYTCPALTAIVNIKIFDVTGRLVRFLCNNQPSGSHGTFFWDGLNDAGQKCRIGIYFIYFEALNLSKNCIQHAAKPLVLAAQF